MKEDIKRFLDSTLLEEYVLGSIDPARIREVENYIQKSPEVKSAYEALQQNIELLASKVAATPPLGTKENILREIDKTIATPKTETTNYTKWWAMAASIAAIGFCLYTFMLSQKQNKLQTDLASLNDQYTTLQNQCEESQKAYALQEEQWKILADAKTEKYIITGNNKAPTLETVAYWNTEKQVSYLQIVSLPDLPKGKCFQLWADVKGEMVSVEVLPKSTGEVRSIPFKYLATSLNITIEPEGGSDHPTVADLVGSVTI